MSSIRSSTKAGLWFLAADLSFWLLYWLLGTGRVELPNVGSHWPTMRLFSQISGVIHAPIDWLFGPSLFQHMAADAEDGALSVGIYVFLCVSWSFAVGFCIAKAAPVWRRLGRLGHPSNRTEED